MIHYISGDLLESKAQVLVNAVNCVGIMGKGIALSFKHQFPDNYMSYKIACEHNNMKIGDIFIYCLDHNRYIFNFPTKYHWRDKTKLYYIEQGLNNLIEKSMILNINSIAFPALGCGNGGLNWADVQVLFETTLRKIDNIDCYIYMPYDIRKGA